MDRIFDWNLSPAGQSLVNVILIWLGFAIVTGLVARAIVPSKLTSGPFVTLLVGLTGCCSGPLLLSNFYPVEDFNPIGLVGFLVSIAAAVACLLLLHLGLVLFPIRDKKSPDKKEWDDKE
ncbi:MAG: hypothetical protein Q4G68_05920 [Planctomycetia bacterium]|nr:hypothetical protein [Planctomycetia bacterium]